MKPQLLISASATGSGKTIFAMGLLRAMKRQGVKVQPYKCGPDFIDSQLMTLAADNESVNLDVWMSSHTHVQHIYNKYGELADVCIIEGSGGLFDGYRRMQGSSAEMAKSLNVPVVLLINARTVGYSIAPVIYGYKHFYSGVHIVGVVFNQVSSPAHYTILREACMDIGIDCLGYLPYSEEFKLNFKHNAMTVANRKTMNRQIDLIANQIEQSVDVCRLINRCNRNFPCQYTLPYCSDMDLEQLVDPINKKKIAVARDSAFNFTYRENINCLSKIGELRYFSPLYSDKLPEADFVYFPGGYPELFARQLHRRQKMIDSLRSYVESGGKILAESGGMMFLGRSIKSRENGTAYPMCNIFPIDFVVPSIPRLNSGYRMANVGNTALKGHECHYSSVLRDDTPAKWRMAMITNLKNTENIMPIYRYKNVIASYVHWYFGDKNILEIW